MKSFVSYFLLFFALQAQSQSLKITYIGNEGVLLEGLGQKVMIDALFDNYYKDYLNPDESMIKNMMDGKVPFDKIDVLLSTHVHRDHFEVALTGQFLSAHPETQYFSSEQIKNELEKEYGNFQSIKGRIQGYVRDENSHDSKSSGIKINSFFVYHSGGKRTESIENMGFIVEVGGIKVLHLGDSDTLKERYKLLNLAQHNIDVALVPYWFLTSEEGQYIIDNNIRPKHLIGIHFPKAGSPLALEEIKKRYPEAKVFKRQLEVANY
jgi:L-ascorbate metabolism protein UlaG (beta-lactamase superfamily)